MFKSTYIKTTYYLIVSPGDYKMIKITRLTAQTSVMKTAVKDDHGN